MSAGRLRNPKGARRFNDLIILTLRRADSDDFGHAEVGPAHPVLECYAEVRQMSASKTLLTFQQADIVGVEIEFRTPPPGIVYNGIRWNGHDIHFPQPQDIGNRGLYTRISGWYQIDHPAY